MTAKTNYRQTPTSKHHPSDNKKATLADGLVLVVKADAYNGATPLPTPQDWLRDLSSVKR